MTQTLGNGTVLQSANNRYTIVRTLGQGSFGITYLATMQVEGPLGAIEVEVAIKEFFMKEINSREGSTVTGGGSSRDSLFDRYRQKFRHEAQNLSLMKHPGVVRVVESFEANNTSYIAMEYLGGGSLDNLIGSQGLPEEEALRYARGIGEALAYMHGQHMLHLDLKPSNVMLNRQGDPVIIDFGLSKQYDDDGNPESSTTVGGGTPGYAPIEQSSYRDGKSFPVTIDVYALGATLFKMLCGHRPPEAPDLFTDGFPYADLKHVSKSTVDIVAKAMAPNKNDRYPSVNDFLSALGVPEVDESTSIIKEETDIKVAKVISTPTSTPTPEPHDGSRPSSLSGGGARRAEGEKPTREAEPAKKKTLLWLLPLLLLARAAVVAVVALGKDADGGTHAANDTNDTLPPKADPMTDTTVNLVDTCDPAQTAPAKEPEERIIPAGYVDLGLPSGTLWKKTNEAGGFYSYDEAKSKFGSRLPTKAQFTELKDKCRWKWTGDGYRVTGPNGNSIVLPASGYRSSLGIVDGVGSYGDYWSTTPDGSDFAWFLGFDSDGVGMYDDNRCYGYSVRLVQD